MENASKALIMAASVLIALVIISCLILMVNNLTTYQGAQTANKEQAQIVKFNNQYSIYNRKDVRGSDLYSLMNKVIDYNKRQSTSGTSLEDNGQYVGYSPMSITIDLNGKREEFAYLDNQNRLFKYDKYSASSTTNELESIKKEINILEKITFDKKGNNNEKFSLNSTVLTNLVTASTKIFIDTDDYNKQLEAIYNFNKVLGYKVLYEPKDDSDLEKSKISTIYKNFLSPSSSIKDTTGKYTLRKCVYTYSEYIQFKRGIFECTDDNGVEGVKYDKNTGKIISMNFKFTGKFN